MATAWPAAAGRAKYPKQVWIACFAAQLHELKPTHALADTVKLAEASYQELCSLEPEFVAYEIALFFG